LSVTDVGGSTVDFYACAAKRYYHFLTGIDVQLRALESETELDTFHRNEVFRLGDRLKTSGSLNGLIRDIFQSRAFQTRNYVSEVSP